MSLSNAPSIKGGFLAIPVAGGKEELDINLNHLFEPAAGAGGDEADFDFVRQVLRAELPPVVYWCLIAQHCLKQGRILEAEQLCSEAAQLYERQAPELVPVHHLMASIALARGRKAPKEILSDARYKVLDPALEAPKSHYAAQAEGIIKQAERALQPVAQSSSARIQYYRQLTSLHRGIFLLSRGQYDTALPCFDYVLKHTPHHAVALLGKGCLLLRKKQWAGALKQYQLALRVVLHINQRAERSRDGAASRWAGPDPRIGIGLAFWGNGQLEDARRAWQRSLALDPHSHSAHTLLGLSALSLAGEPHALDGFTSPEAEAAKRDEYYNEGIKHVQAAFKIDNRNAILAVALCSHFITKADLLIESGLLSASDDQEWVNVRNHLTAALKLGEHAIQYAELFSAAIQAKVHFARALQMMSYLPGGEIALRTVAQRYYTRVLEDSNRQQAAGGVAVDPSKGLQVVDALAIVGLAQIQISTGSMAVAKETLTRVLPKAQSSGSAALEILLLAVSLGVQPTLSPTLLERALKMAEAAAAEAERLTGYPDEDKEHVFPASSDFSRSNLKKEALGVKALRAIGSLLRDPLVFVELADFVRAQDPGLAARAYAAGLRAIEDNSAATKRQPSTRDVALSIQLRSNLGAALALQALEHTGQQADADARAALLEQATTELQGALVAAAKIPAGSPESTAADAVRVISLYNYARVCEVTDPAKAEQAYQTVLSAHPEYVDAKVRLALLQVSGVKEGAAQAAEAYFKEALISDNTNLDTRLAYVIFRAGQLPGSPKAEWKSVKEFLAEVFQGPTSGGQRAFGSKTAAKEMQVRAQHDASTLAALGWTYYQAHIHSKPGADAKAERTKVMYRAIDLFDRALQVDKLNAFAAQGMAVLLAEDALAEAAAEKQPSSGIAQAAAALRADERRKKSAEEAIAILSKLRDVRDDASVYICHGHAFMIREDFDRAIQAYEVAASRFHPEGKPSILQNLARAEYAKGLSRKIPLHLWRSIDYLDQARERLEARGDATSELECRWIRYNEAVTRMQLLTVLHDLRSDKRSSEEMRRAVEGMKDALKIFAELLPVAQKHQLAHITPDHIEQRMQFGETTLLPQSEGKVSEQVAYEATVAAAREEAEALLAEKEALKDRARAEREAEEARRAAELAARRQAAKERLNEVDWATLNAAAAAEEKRSRTSGGKGRKKKQREEEADLGIVADESDEDANGLFAGGASDDEGLAKSGSEDEAAKASKALRRLKRKKATQKRNAKKKPATSDSGLSDAPDDSDPEPRPKKKKRGKPQIMDEDDIIDSDEEV